MAAPSSTPPRPGTGVMIVVAALLAFAAVALVGFLGGGYAVGALFPIIIVAGLIVLVARYVKGNKEVHEITQTAEKAGAPTPLEYWGKVIVATGSCPAGPMPEEGTTFIVSGDRIWPEPCIHAREAIHGMIDRIADDEASTSEAARVHDNDHHIVMEVHRTPSDARTAA